MRFVRVDYPPWLPDSCGQPIVYDGHFLNQFHAGLDDSFEDLHRLVRNLGLPALRALEARYVLDYHETRLELHREDSGSLMHFASAIEARHGYLSLLVFMSGMNVALSGLYAVTT